jgi:hypothetical protein
LNGAMIFSCTEPKEWCKMDFNLMSCPTCGHSVSNASGACAYCGAMMTEDEQPQAAEKGAAGSVQPDESIAPSLPPEATAAVDGSEPSDQLPVLVNDQPNPAGSLELSETLSEAIAGGTDAEAEPGADMRKESRETAILQPGIEAEPEMKTEAENVPLPHGGRMESHVPLTEDLNPENAADSNEFSIGDTILDLAAVENEAILTGVESAEPVSKDVQTISPAGEELLAPEPDLPDADVDEPSESEIMEEDIIDLAEVHDIQSDSENVPIPETSVPLETSAAVGDIESPETSRAPNDAGIQMDAKAGLMTESLGDTILLEAVDEVQPDAEKVPQKIDKSAKTAFVEEALKIEKTEQAVTPASNGPKATLAETQDKMKSQPASAKAQAVKKQKAVLAKTRAVKKHKMSLAKAAALKRKKAAQAKAQDVKKKESVRTGVANVKKEEIVVLEKAASPTGKVSSGMGKSFKLKKLLEKYKGQPIGINYDNSADIRKAQLVEANGEYFSVLVKEKKLLYSYPLKNILTVIEGKDGVEAGGSGKNGKFNVIIKVYPLVLF